MQTLALVLTLTAGVAQLVGVLLLVARAHAARELLRSGAHQLVDGGNALGHASQPSTVDVLDFLLRDAVSTWWAVALILVGILASTVAGVVSLGA